MTKKGTNWFLLAVVMLTLLCCPGFLWALYDGDHITTWEANTTPPAGSSTDTVAQALREVKRAVENDAALIPDPDVTDQGDSSLTGSAANLSLSFRNTQTSDIIFKGNRTTNATYNFRRNFEFPLRTVVTVENGALINASQGIRTGSYSYTLENSGAVSIQNDNASSEYRWYSWPEYKNGICYHPDGAFDDICANEGMNHVYYLALVDRSDPKVPEPDLVKQSTTTLTKRDLSALSNSTPGSWAYGNNEALGFETIWIVTTGGTNPDDLSDNTITGQWSWYYCTPSGYTLNEPGMVWQKDDSERGFHALSENAHDKMMAKDSWQWDSTNSRLRIRLSNDADPDTLESGALHAGFKVVFYGFNAGIHKTFQIYGDFQFTPGSVTSVRPEWWGASAIQPRLWEAGKQYDLYAEVYPTSYDNDWGGYVFRASTVSGNGISGSTEPTWANAPNVGDTITDGDITWMKYMASPDGNGIQFAFDAVKASNFKVCSNAGGGSPKIHSIAVEFAPNGMYETNFSLFAGDMPGTNEGVRDIWGNGSTIVGKCDSENKWAVIDYTGTSSKRVVDMWIWGDPVHPPGAGLLLARARAKDVAGDGYYERLRILGYYHVAPLYNWGSESNTFMDCWLSIEDIKRLDDETYKPFSTMVFSQLNILGMYAPRSQTTNCAVAKQICDVSGCVQSAQHLNNNRFYGSSFYKNLLQPLTCSSNCDGTKYASTIKIFGGNAILFDNCAFHDESEPTGNPLIYLGYESKKVGNLVWGIAKPYDFATDSVSFRNCMFHRDTDITMVVAGRHKKLRMENNRTCGPHNADVVGVIEKYEFSTNKFYYMEPILEDSYVDCDKFRFDAVSDSDNADGQGIPDKFCHVLGDSQIKARKFIHISGISEGEYQLDTDDLINFTENPKVAAWKPNTVYSVGTYVIPREAAWDDVVGSNWVRGFYTASAQGSSTKNKFVYRCIGSGTSGYKQPVFSDFSGGFTMDNEVKWKAVDKYELSNDTWTASTAYAVGDIVRGTTAITKGYYFRCTVAGTSGASQPSWKTDFSLQGSTEGSTTTTDGSVTWVFYRDRSFWEPFKDFGKGLTAGVPHYGANDFICVHGYPDNVYEVYRNQVSPDCMESDCQKTWSDWDDAGPSWSTTTGTVMDDGTLYAEYEGTISQLRWIAWPRKTFVPSLYYPNRARVSFNNSRTRIDGEKTTYVFEGWTNNATVSVIGLFDVPEGSVYQCKLTAAALNNDYSDYGMYANTWLIQNPTTAAASTIGAFTNIHAQVESVASMDIGVAYSTSTCKVRGTGLASHNLLWKSQVECEKVFRAGN